MNLEQNRVVVHASCGRSEAKEGSWGSLSFFCFFLTRGLPVAKSVFSPDAHHTEKEAVVGR